MNEKIESLTGQQRVIILASNIKYLMLRWDVVQAAKAGQFATYAVETVDETLQYLSNMDAGSCDEKGVFPADSFNGKVQQQLLTLNTIQQQFKAHEK
ncbi:MAG: hypothetical protein IBX55_17145 [Methyloprofundus sp.]|nr:hypothetical protein [Methyloprofundus sp.]MBW6454130.1 hypothetical protein [Methyloprofundus sp.]